MRISRTAPLGITTLLSREAYSGSRVLRFRSNHPPAVRRGRLRNVNTVIVKRKVECNERLM
jgi:hypothetical protein